MHSIHRRHFLDPISHRFQDSIGEIDDASGGRVEEVFASELRDAPGSLHDKSLRRQFTHTRV